MNNICIFWNHFNWLEFVTYILIPTAMVLVILVYIYFNIRLFKLTFDFDIDLVSHYDESNEKQLQNLKRKINDTYTIVNEHTKEKV